MMDISCLELAVLVDAFLLFSGFRFERALTDQDVLRLFLKYNRLANGFSFSSLLHSQCAVAVSQRRPSRTLLCISGRSVAHLLPPCGRVFCQQLPMAQAPACQPFADIAESAPAFAADSDWPGSRNGEYA